jgi:hypothetical protein
MKKTGFLRWVMAVFLCFTLSGCVATPKGFLKPTEDSLQKRQLQMRQYDTKDEKMVIAAVAGVAQDLGFTLDDSESEIGLISFSTVADATHAGQITMAVMADVLCALGGTYSNATAQCDKEQKVKASVVVKPSLDGNTTIVRVTFQRIVWNMQNQVSKIETISDPEIYEKFFSALSKSIFLEAHEI